MSEPMQGCATEAVASPADERCQVCAGEIEAVEFVCEVNPYVGRHLRGLRCSGCGLLRFPENVADFVAVSSTGMERELRNLRNANSERPGREFRMAQMGIEILDRPDAAVTFFGAGVNTDWQWLQRSYPQSRTTLVDLENLQAVPNFEAISDARPADIVIASEVIEHFGEPVAHFQSLLRLLKDDGILICSSNIYDGTDIRRHMYPFVPGHVVYWTPLALIQVAASARCFVDFRVPEIALTRGGPRKKYILFYRHAETAFRVSLYFGTRMFAPSEAS